MSTSPRRPAPARSLARSWRRGHRRGRCRDGPGRAGGEQPGTTLRVVDLRKRKAEVAHRRARFGYRDWYQVACQPGARSKKPRAPQALARRAARCGGCHRRHSCGTLALCGSIVACPRAAPRPRPPSAAAGPAEFDLLPREPARAAHPLRHALPHRRGERAYCAQFAPRGCAGRTCHEVSHHIAVPLRPGRRAARWHAPRWPARAACCTCTTRRRARPTADRARAGARPPAPLLGSSRSMEPPCAWRTARPGRRPDRPLGAVPRDARAGGAGRPLGGERAAGRRIGHRQGTGRARGARGERAGRPLVVVDCASLPETLFERASCSATRRAPSLARTRPRRAGGGRARRHAVPRRSRRHPADHAGEAPAPARWHLPARRQHRAAPRRRAPVSATHRDLHALIAAGRFPRGSVPLPATFLITGAPPLRERRGDILLLAALLFRAWRPSASLLLAPAAADAVGAAPFSRQRARIRALCSSGVALLADGSTLTAAVIERALPPAAARAVVTAGHGAGRRAAAQCRVRGAARRPRCPPGG